MKKMLQVVLSLSLVALMLVMSVSATPLTVFEGGAADSYDNASIWNGTSGAMVQELILDEPIDVSAYDSMYMRVYINGADKCSTNHQIEITSSGEPDQQENALNSFTVVEGWNLYELDLASLGSACNYSAVNFIRMYQYATDASFMVLDWVAFDDAGKTEADFASLNTELGNIKAPLPLISTVSAGYEAEGGAPSFGFSLIDPIDTTPYTHVWVSLTVTGRSSITDQAEFELCSGGSCDSDENHVVAWNSSLVEGENLLKLPLSSFSNGGGTPDMSKINYCRAYNFVDGEVEVEVHYLGFGSETEVSLYVIKPEADRLDTTALEDALEAAYDVTRESVDNHSKEDFTTETWNAFYEARRVANHQSSNINLTAADMKTYTDNLVAAYKALTLAAGGTPYSGETPVTPPSGEGTQKPPVNPPTADYGLAIAAVALLAGCTAVIVSKKRR